MSFDQIRHVMQMQYSGGLERSHELHARVYDSGLLVVSLRTALRLKN